MEPSKPKKKRTAPKDFENHRGIRTRVHWEELNGATVSWGQWSTSVEAPWSTWSSRTWVLKKVIQSYTHLLYNLWDHSKLAGVSPSNCKHWGCPMSSREKLASQTDVSRSGLSIHSKGPLYDKCASGLTRVSQSHTPMFTYDWQTESHYRSMSTNWWSGGTVKCCLIIPSFFNLMPKNPGGNSHLEGGSAPLATP